MSRISPALLDERGQCGGPLAGAQRVDVHARGYDGDPLGVYAHELAEDAGHVAGPGQDDSRAGKGFPGPGAQLGVPPHGELQFRPVRLDEVRQPGRRPNRGTEQHVVDQQEVRGALRPYGRRIRRHERLPISAAHLRQQPRLHVLVRSHDENRERPGQTRPDDRGAVQVVALGMRLLAEDHDLVAHSTPRPGEFPGVDVGAAALEKIAVPDQGAHWIRVRDGRLRRLVFRRRGAGSRPVPSASGALPQAELNTLVRLLLVTQTGWLPGTKERTSS
jgi:hypothetical protein